MAGHLAVIQREGGDSRVAIAMSGRCMSSKTLSWHSFSLIEICWALPSTEVKYDGVLQWLDQKCWIAREERDGGEN